MNNDIKQFILNLQSKNYSDANSTLESIIEKKLTARIQKSAKKATDGNFFKKEKTVKKNK